MARTSLLDKLRADYAGFTFVAGDEFRYCPCPDDQAGGTIYYADETNHACLLHELSHAILGHLRYDLDIDLLKIERAAWDYTARILAPHYGITIMSDDVEDALDTYRDWLHNRSLCPSCHNSGLQRSDGAYACVLCLTQWHANEARLCALRRRVTPRQKILSI